MFGLRSRKRLHSLNAPGRWLFRTRCATLLRSEVHDCSISLLGAASTAPPATFIRRGARGTQPDQSLGLRRRMRGRDGGRVRLGPARHARGGRAARATAGPRRGLPAAPGERVPAPRSAFAQARPGAAPAATAAGAGHPAYPPPEDLPSRRVDLPGPERGPGASPCATGPSARTRASARPCPGAPAAAGGPACLLRRLRLIECPPVSVATRARTPTARGR